MAGTRVFRLLLTFVVFTFAIAMTACGSGSSTSGTTPSTTSGPTTSTSGSTVPVVQHVAIVMVENHAYGEVVGSSSMPYLNSLIKQGGLATNYYASGHPSLPNYFMLTTGQTLVTEDASPVQNVDSVVRALGSAGKTWKGYFQSLPSTGYMGLDVPPYIKHHNPFAYLSDVVNSTALQANIVNYSQLSSDISANALPNYIFIVPDDNNQGGNCPTGGTNCTSAVQLAAADAWLQANVPQLLNSSAFNQSGILIITFDESFQTDTTNGGGHTAWVILGTKVKAGYQSSTFYQHPSTLKLMMQALGVSSFPGAAASAATMSEFFQ